MRPSVRRFQVGKWPAGDPDRGRHRPAGPVLAPAPGPRPPRRSHCPCRVTWGGRSGTPRDHPSRTPGIRVTGRMAAMPGYRHGARPLLRLRSESLVRVLLQAGTSRMSRLPRSTPVTPADRRRRRPGRVGRSPCRRDAVTARPGGLARESDRVGPAARPVPGRARPVTVPGHRVRRPGAGHGGHGPSLSRLRHRSRPGRRPSARAPGVP
jgi:hypothetical protein